MKKILPPTHFYIYLIIAIILHYTVPLIQIFNYPYYLIGFLFFIIGAVLNIWADQLLKKQKTTVKPNEKPTVLIETGAFKISRNPMYFGMAVILFGAGFILGSIISFIGVVLFVAAMEIAFIPMEEKNLSEQFGEEFEAYKKKVRRWI
ncbi:MAG: isoprenylcysteine carboxylmethyltransferase family protein [Ignavibacteria bacterium]|nr:isoprenylcysteine carboxylmethyltransferase family protein [Ignavibacteria bacterium]